ncbi:hypothetical protein V8C86DRAFT_1621378 [Haematococcus lacustris]
MSRIPTGFDSSNYNGFSAGRPAAQSRRPAVQDSDSDNSPDEMSVPEGPPLGMAGFGTRRRAPMPAAPISDQTGLSYAFTNGPAVPQPQQPSARPTPAGTGTALANHMYDLHVSEPDSTSSVISTSSYNSRSRLRTTLPAPSSPPPDPPSPTHLHPVPRMYSHSTSRTPAASKNSRDVAPVSPGGLPTQGPQVSSGRGPAFTTSAALAYPRPASPEPSHTGFATRHGHPTPSPPVSLGYSAHKPESASRQQEGRLSTTHRREPGPAPPGGRHSLVSTPPSASHQSRQPGWLGTAKDCELQLEECEDFDTAGASRAGGVSPMADWRAGLTASGGRLAQGTPLPPDTARTLRTLLWGPQGQPPASWKQGLFFNSKPSLGFGLVQLEGGPCGVLAGVQAHVLANLQHAVSAWQASTPGASCCHGALIAEHCTTRVGCSLRLTPSMSLQMTPNTVAFPVGMLLLLLLLL